MQHNRPAPAPRFSAFDARSSRARGTVDGVTDADDLRGRVALVAGASRGLGLLIARELAARGCRVAICARDSDELERARVDLAGRGAEVLARPCDVSDRAQVTALVEHVTSRLGPVDVLVNVAGVIQVGPLETLPDDALDVAMGVMFWGPVHLTRAVLPSMRARKAGRIATITSIGGKISVPHLLPYSAAKFASVGFFEGLRAELAGTGVAVTTVVPGLMRTGSHVRADFGGQSSREYAWFALGASLPLVSMDAERAAAQIVDAVRDRRREVVLTPLGKVAVRFSGVAPATTIALLELMGRLLPRAPHGDRVGSPGGLAEGRAADGRLASALHRRVTAMGWKAAQRFNQL